MADRNVSKDFRIIVPVKVQHPCTKSAAPFHQRCSIGTLTLSHSETAGKPQLPSIDSQFSSHKIRLKSLLSCQGTIKRKSKYKSKKKSKNKSVKRLRNKSDTPWVFFDSSSVAAGSQSAMLQIECRITSVLSWPQISRIKRVYTMSQPTRFVRFVRFVFEKHISVWIILSWPQISRISRIYTGSQPTRFVRFVRLVFEKNISVLVSMIHRVRLIWM